MTPSEDLLARGSVVEKYTIEGVLGSGGMATVYRVRHNVLGTTHALKVLTQTSASIRRRLMLEGQVQARLSHTHVVGVTDVLDLQGGVGLVLEYVDGTDLDTLIAHKRLSVEQLDALAEGIFRGVEYAHNHGLVHRDLKPANVLLKTEGRRIVPKVADFGLVKDSGELSSTRSGVAMGTPRYMAPEQIRDAKTVDVRSDVFSLGALCYHMVTGVEAFSPDNDDIVMVFMAIYAGDYVPVRERRPDLPDRIVTAIETALAVEPGDRHSSVSAFRSAWYDVSEEGSVWDLAELSGAHPVEITESLPELVAPGENVDGTYALTPMPARRSQRTPQATLAPTPGSTDVTAASSAPPAEAAAAAVDRTVWWLGGGAAVAVAMMVVAITGLVGVGVGTWTMGDEPPTTAEVHEPRTPQPPPAPLALPTEPEPEPEPESEAEPEPASEAEPEPAPGEAAEAPPPPTPTEPSQAATERPQPAPAPVVAAAPVPPAEPEPEPEPPPAPVPEAAPVPTTATFTATGARAYLRADGVDQRPGEVAPGTYAVHATIDGRSIDVARAITVAAGQEVVVSCKPMLSLCSVEVLP